MQQAALLFSGAMTDAERRDGDVSRLKFRLSGQGWMTAKQLSGYGYTDRELRHLASASNGDIISGQQGYRLTVEASVEEVDHAEKWLISQANAMRERAVEIRRARNRRVA